MHGLTRRLGRRHVLMDYHNSGSSLARLFLDNVTDRDLRLCLSYTIMPPIVPDNAEGEGIDLQVRFFSRSARSTRALHLIQSPPSLLRLFFDFPVRCAVLW